MLKIPSVNDCKAYLHKVVNYIENTENGLVYLAGCVMLLCCCFFLLFRPRKRRR